jgi:cyclase
MLKRRIIPVELLLDGRLVKTVGFDRYRDVGDPLKSSLVYSDQDADELILLNIGRERRDPVETAAHLRAIAGKCFMPLAVGGGVRSVDDAALLFSAGADKVVVNSAAYDAPELISVITDRWGSQSLVVSVDVLRRADGSYVLRSDCGRKAEEVDPLVHMRSILDAGAGELLVNSIQNDGVMEGYDLDIVRLFRPLCRVPLIVCGGAGHYQHLKDAFDLGVNAVACGSLFNFGDNNPLRAKSFLKNYDVPLKRI